MRKHIITAIAPFKFIQGHRFWYQSKALYNFLLVNNTNLHPVSHRFEVIADYLLVKLLLSTARDKTLFNAFVRDKLLNSRLRGLATRNYRNIALSFGVKYNSIS